MTETKYLKRLTKGLIEELWSRLRELIRNNETPRDLKKEQRETVVYWNPERVRALQEEDTEEEV